MFKNKTSLFFILLSLILAFGILLSSLWKASIPKSQLAVKNNFTQSKVILPGNPLYLTLMIQDRLSLMCSFSDTRKTSKLINLADKRLATGLELIRIGQIDTGLSTISKGEKYLQQAYMIDPSSEKTLSVIQKHYQILFDLKTQLDSEPQSLKESLDLSRSLLKI